MHCHVVYQCKTLPLLPLYRSMTDGSEWPSSPETLKSRESGSSSAILYITALHASFVYDLSREEELLLLNRNFINCRLKHCEIWNHGQI